MSFLNDLVTLNDVINFMRDKGVLKSILYCESCNSVLSETQYKRNIDKRAFKCNKKECENFQKYISIRKNTFFEKYNIELKKILFVMYNWFKEELQTQTARDFGLSRFVVEKIYNHLKILSNFYVDGHPIILGGPGVICQIDESMFRYKQKYHVGRVDSRYRWVFGITDTSTRPAKYYVKVVEDRSARNLLSIITRFVKNGSIIWSDQWASYRNVNSLGFEHATVNHNFNFVNPITGVHTQTAESLWNRLKRRLKRINGNPLETLKKNLKMWMWKDNVAKNDFNYVFELRK